MATLDGYARNGAPVDTSLRVAVQDGARWVDMGTPTGEVIRLDAKGWTIGGTAPVWFARTVLTGPMPTPTPGGDIDRLWQVVNVAEPDRPLILAWLVAALAFPDVAHPVLILAGEQGAAKSTATRALANLVDPSTTGPRTPPREPEQWVTSCQASWIVALDNLSRLSDWMSDAICRAVTGDADVKRRLYTDGEPVLFRFRRAVILNGISLDTLRGDLADRALRVNLPRIGQGERCNDTDIDQMIRAAHPAILGGLLDLAVRVLANPVALDQKPRMADYAEILAAVDQQLGTNGQAQYANTAQAMAADSLADDRFVTEVMSQLTQPWQGTAADLLANVTVPDGATRAQLDWPKSPAKVSDKLGRKAPAMRSMGWQVDNDGGRNHLKVRRWELTPPEKGGKTPPQYPQYPLSQVTGLKPAGEVSPQCPRSVPAVSPQYPQAKTL